VFTFAIGLDLVLPGLRRGGRGELLGMTLPILVLTLLGRGMREGELSNLFCPEGNHISRCRHLLCMSASPLIFCRPLSRSRLLENGAGGVEDLAKVRTVTRSECHLKCVVFALLYKANVCVLQKQLSALPIASPIPSGVMPRQSLSQSAVRAVLLQQLDVVACCSHMYRV